MNEILDGAFNTTLNWACGILWVVGMVLQAAIPETKGAMYLLVAGLSVFALKGLLEVIKIVKFFKDWNK